MDFGAIKYIFQIPIEWYKKIHNRVFNSYGTNFLIVREGYYGGTEIGIDSDLFAEQVKQNIDLSGIVRSVNDTLPDADGNVELDIPELPDNIVNTVNGQTGDVVLGNIVNSVNGVSPVNGDVDLGDIVYSVNNIGPVNGNVDISSVSMEDVEDYIDEQGFALTSDLTNYALTSDLTNYALTSDLEDYAHTVDGHPAIDGEVDFALLGNKWVKTDSSGHLDTTDEVPIALSSGNNGYLYANNGSLQFKQDEYVTLSTEQTITATKRFDNCNVVAREGGRLMVTNSQSQGAGTSISESSITIANNNPFIHIQTASGTVAGTIYLGAAQPGLVLHAGSDYIELYAQANKAVLDAQPTETTTNSLAIATCGYVQSQLSGTTTSSPVKMVTGVTWNGTQIVIESKNLSFKNGILTAMTNNSNTYINTVAYT